jgi:two-component system, OmpR family, aerobic respiration control protein ArcA
VNGFELAQMLKEHRELKHIPLIFLSASADEDDLQKGRDVGADDYIKKPFDIEKLKSRIKEILVTKT